jgi:hypothetical protein
VVGLLLFLGAATVAQTVHINAVYGALGR